MCAKREFSPEETLSEESFGGNILKKHGLKRKLFKMTGLKCLPIIAIKGEIIGNYDSLLKLIENGEVQKRVKPHFSVSICGKCRQASQNGKPLSRCGKCKMIAYCSVECQTLHWKAVHKKGCGKCIKVMG